MDRLLTVQRWVRLLCTALGVAGALMVMTMVFLVTADVVGRDTMNAPIPGSFELVEYFMVVAVFCALGVAQVNHFHVTIDVLASRVPKRWRAALDSITLLMILVFYCVATWMCYIRALRLHAMMQVSSVLLIPKWPFMAVVVVGLGSFCLAVAIDLVFAVARALGREVEVPQRPSETLKAV